MWAGTAGGAAAGRAGRRRSSSRTPTPTSCSHRRASEARRRLQRQSSRIQHTRTVHSSCLYASTHTQTHTCDESRPKSGVIEGRHHGVGGPLLPAPPPSFWLVLRLTTIHLQSSATARKSSLRQNVLHQYLSRPRPPPHQNFPFGASLDCCCVEVCHTHAKTGSRAQNFAPVPLTRTLPVFPVLDPVPMIVLPVLPRRNTSVESATPFRPLSGLASPHHGLFLGAAREPARVGDPLGTTGLSRARYFPGPFCVFSSAALVASSAIPAPSWDGRSKCARA